MTALCSNPNDLNSIRNKIENLVSHGFPVCDVCRDMKPERRPGYTTDNPTLYIDVTGQTLVEWTGKTVCPLHSEACTTGTHKVECEMVDAPDYHLKTGRRYTVKSIEIL